jgi:hypothetical protein
MGVPKDMFPRLPFFFAPASHFPVPNETAILIKTSFIENMCGHRARQIP